nr:MAG TPA: hypothetical protein [Herelleviridae sp.]
MLVDVGRRRKKRESHYAPLFSPFQSFAQTSQYTASVRPRYLMLLSVMLVQTVQPHSVQKMDMVVSLYVSFCS